MYRTRYLVIQDLDELIVPLRTESLAELVHSVDAAISADGVTATDSLAAYNFRNLFFPPNGPNDPRFGPNSAAVKYNIGALLKTSSSVLVHPKGSRQKVRKWTS